MLKGHTAFQYDLFLFAISLFFVQEPAFWQVLSLVQGWLSFCNSSFFSYP